MVVVLAGFGCLNCTKIASIHCLPTSLTDVAYIYCLQTPLMTFLTYHRWIFNTQKSSQKIYHGFSTLEIRRQKIRLDIQHAKFTDCQKKVFHCHA